MADSKITDLTALVTTDPSDVLVIVDDPGGTPVTKKITVANLVGTSLTALVQDTSPQLGGDLDSNSFNIKIDDDTGINDENNNEQIKFQTVASAINYTQFTNAVSAAGPTIESEGSDANIDLNISAKGTGIVKIDGLEANVTVANFVSAYDTTTQTVAVANTFQTVTFNKNSELDGWNHSETINPEDFTCNQTGKYIISIGGHITKSGGSSSFGELRITLNGTEVVGSAFGSDLSTNNEIKSTASSSIISATSGDVLNLEFTGTTTTTQIILPTGNATTDVSVSISISRIQ